MSLHVDGLTKVCKLCFCFLILNFTIKHGPLKIEFRLKNFSYAIVISFSHFFVSFFVEGDILF